MRATISRAEVLAFVRSLGADPARTRAVYLRHDAIAVETYKLNGQGARYVEEGSDEPATETTVIRIVGPSEGSVRMRHPNLDREIDVPAAGAGQRAAAGWEVVEAAAELTGEPYVWTGGQAADNKQPESAPEEPKTPRRRKTSKESDD